ncbi:MAG: hypothetical protein IKJ94_01975 [Oscillospiraceae bacterium]|nr:hypothetical protein [Oscillospiraceae bacterium]
MRKLVYAAILGLLFLAPVKRLDVANLQPVQTVAIYTEPGFVVLETDTHNLGRGTSVTEAVANLEENTPGVIYLDTAEYLLVSKDAEAYVDALREYLSPSVKVSLWVAGNEVDIAAKFLAEEDNLPKLKNWKKF